MSLLLTFESLYKYRQSTIPQHTVYKVEKVVYLDTCTVTLDDINLEAAKPYTL